MHTAPDAAARSPDMCAPAVRQARSLAALSHLVHASQDLAAAHPHSHALEALVNEARQEALLCHLRRHDGHLRQGRRHSQARVPIKSDQTYAQHHLQGDGN